MAAFDAIEAFAAWVIKASPEQIEEATKKYAPICNAAGNKILEVIDQFINSIDASELRYMEMLSGFGVTMDDIVTLTMHRRECYFKSAKKNQ